MTEIERWIDDYVEAWRTPGTDTVTTLFSPEATYSQGPYRDPVRGLAAIAEMWEAERPEGERFDISHEVVATEGDTSVVRVEVDYRAPHEQQWRDLWIVVLGADGRCRHFEEWPFAPPAGSP